MRFYIVFCFEHDGSPDIELLDTSRELLAGLRQGVTEHTKHFFSEVQNDNANKQITISVKDSWSSLGLHGFENEFIQSIGNCQILSNMEKFYKPFLPNLSGWKRQIFAQKDIYQILRSPGGLCFV